MKRTLKNAILILLFFSSSLFPDEKKILIINSFSQDNQWTKIINAGIIGVLRKELPECKFYYEYADGYFLDFDEIVLKKSEEILESYSSENLSLIVCIDYIAIEIYLKLREKIFKDIPAVFTGINFYDKELFFKETNIYFVDNYLPIKETLSLIVKFHNNIKNIILLTDGSYFSERLKQKIYEQTENFEHLNIISLETKQILQNNIEKLNFTENSAGIVLSLETPPQIRGVSKLSLVEALGKTIGVKIPLYTIISLHLGKGVVGGKTVSSIACGKAAGIMASRILKKENMPQNFYEIYNVSKYYFDYRKLVEFNIDFVKIPNGSSTLFTPQPRKVAIEEKKIATAIVSFVLALAFAFILFWYNSKLRKLKNQLEFDKIKFKTLSLNASSIILAYNKDYQLIFSNEYLEKSFGISILEIANLSEVQIISKKESQKIQNAIDVALQQNIEIKNLEISIEFKNEEKKYFLCSVNPVTETKYKSEPFVLLTLHDITELKKIENDLTEQNNFINEIINSLKDPFFVVDFNTKKIVLANSACLLPSNYREMTCCNLISEEKETCNYYENPYCPISPFIKNGEKTAWGRFAPFRYINSGYYDFNYSPIFNNDGTLNKIIVYASEVTDKIWREEKIKKLLLATEENPSAVVIVSKEGLVEYANKSYEKISGFSIKEVIGVSLKKEFNPIFNFKGADKFWSKLISQKNYRMELLNRRKNLDEYWEEIQGVAISDESGNPLHYIIIKQDINYRKILENELIKAKIEAEKSDKLKSEFLAQMSHEIRTPVNAIVSFSSFLRDELKDKVDEELSIAFEALNNGSKRLIRTIELILDMAQLQSGAYKPKFESVNLVTDILIPAVQEYEPSFYKNNLYLKFNVETKRDLRFLLDKYSIKQTFIQLLDNALKYTHKGGVEIIVYNNNDLNVVVDIKDTGIGISEDYFPYLFKVFSQEERGYTRRYEGNGLGLAIAKKFAKINNADIKVFSKKGEGSIFSVEFNKMV